MHSAQESRQARIISELRVFIRKVLSDPKLAGQCMDIARKLKDEPNANQLIAREISASTIVRIPEVQTDADNMFLEIIWEVLDDEAALY